MAAVKLTLSPEEKIAYPYLFKKADTTSLGVLTGDVAVEFFKNSQLPPHLLGEIWQLADSENTGFLTENAFNLTCRLIGYAQGGAKPSLALASKPGPLPKFANITIPGLPKAQSPLPSGGVKPIAPQSTGASSINASRINPQLTGQAASRLVPQSTGSSISGLVIGPEEKARFGRLFLASGPVNGLLDGDKARDVFIKSKLPFEKLGQIWTLADSRARGALDQTDFTIGMFLIQNTMNGRLPTLPSVIPASLYESISGVSALSPQSTGVRAVPPPVRTSTISTASGLGHSAFGRAAFPGSPTNSAIQVPWDVSPSEKVSSDGFFDTLDPARKGFIEGDVAVPFFLESALPEAVLAHIWDLSDIRREGKLNRDEFAVAMKLITDRLAGKDLPTALPISMIPPSLRSLTGVGQDASATRQQVPTAHQELMDLMNDGPTSPVTTPAPSAFSVQHTSNSSLSGHPPTLSPQHTAATSASFMAPPVSPMNLSRAAGRSPPPRDIFAEEDATPISLSADSAQIGNIQNQLNQTTQATAGITSQRKTVEQTVASNQITLDELNSKLTLAKSAHDVESKRLDDLKARQAEQTKEINRLRGELITAESEVSALKVERSEVEGGWLRDKEEVREMKSRMQNITEETNLVKQMLEKVKKEARQQKGLVAITRKQLQQMESEKDKLNSELSEVEKENVEISKEIEDNEKLIAAKKTSLAGSPPGSGFLAAASGVALPISPPPEISRSITPAGSIRSTNPFERLATPAPVSPQPTGPGITPEAATALTVGAVAVGSLATIAATSSAPEESDDEDENDPFSGGGPATPAPHAVAFDDDFNAAFADPTPVHPAADLSSGINNLSFDDAFTDFDDAQAAKVVAVPTSDSTVSSEPVDVAREMKEEGHAKGGEEEEDSDDDDDEGPEEAVGGRGVGKKEEEEDEDDDDVPLALTKGKGKAKDEADEAADKFPSLDNLGTVLPAPVAQPPDVKPVETVVTPQPTIGTMSSSPESIIKEEPPKPVKVPALAPTEFDFDDSFAEFDPIPTNKTGSNISALPAPTEDFDRAFSDFDNAFQPPPAASGSKVTPGFDMSDFDAAFSAAPAPGAKPQGQDSLGPPPPFSESFDGAFADAFGGSTAAPTAPATGGFSFDDAFGTTSAPPATATRPAPPPGQPVFSVPKGAPPPTPARPTYRPPSSAAPDDAPAVKSICAMGFTRQQAVKALEKHGYNVQKAIDSLLK